VSVRKINKKKKAPVRVSRTGNDKKPKLEINKEDWYHYKNYVQ
jgi:hypothetical protein